MTETNRTAIVTGGAGRLGQAITERLLEDGLTVVVADINAEAATTTVSGLAKRYGSRVSDVVVDLGDIESIRALVATVGERYGRIDVLINNAAFNRRATLAQLDPAAWDLMSDVNLRGPAFLAQAIEPYWKRQGSGSIVNIASRVWLSGGPVAYTALKAGIVGLTRAFATELAPWGVTANAVAPSYLPSNFTSSDRSDAQIATLTQQYLDITPLKRLPEPIDIANAVAFLSSPGASFITGEVLHVCGGSQLAPLPRSLFAADAS